LFWDLCFRNVYINYKSILETDFVWVGDCHSKGYHHENECGCGEQYVPPAPEFYLELAEFHPEDLIITCESSSGIFHTTLSEGKNY
jgi:hypothetical protein